MTYVLNAPAAIAVETTARPGIWQRLYAALIESRRRSAMRELRAHAMLVGEAELVLGGYPQTALGDDAKLPFNR